MKNILKVFIITIISVLFLSACTSNENPKDEKNNDTNSRDELNAKFIEIVKEKYDSIQYENDTVIVISLEDMEKVYKTDISKFKEEKLGCSLEMSNVKIEVKDNKKTYISNLNCSGLKN